MTTYSPKADYQYFIDNRSKLFEQYPGKFLVIKNKEILGSYDDKVTAYLETSKEQTAGTFIIQECNPDADIPVQMFHSRVVF